MNDDAIRGVLEKQQAAMQGLMGRMLGQHLLINRLVLSIAVGSKDPMAELDGLEELLLQDVADIAGLDDDEISMAARAKAREEVIAACRAVRDGLRQLPPGTR